MCVPMNCMFEGGGGKMGAPSPHHVPLAVFLISANVFEIQDYKFMSSVCVYSAHMLTSVPKNVCDVTVEPPLGRPLLLPFELNPS